MNRTKTQFLRLQELDACIRDGKYPNCLRFSREWEVSQKTVQRDIDFLKFTLGAPIEYDRGRQGYFYTDNHWFLPALDISEGDLFALLVGEQALSLFKGTPIATQLRRVFDKIAGSLPETVSVAPEYMVRDMTFVGTAVRPVDSDIWKTIVRGLQASRALDVTYRAEAKPQSKSYRIHPYHLANLHGDWHLLACMPPHEDVTQFAVSRFEKITLSDTLFTRPALLELKAQLQNSFGQFIAGSNEKHHPIRLQFEQQHSLRLQERIWHPQQKLTLRKDGGCVLDFSAASLVEVMRWVLSWGAGVKVLGPTELREMVRTEVGRMYGTAL